MPYPGPAATTPATTHLQPRSIDAMHHAAIFQLLRMLHGRLPSLGQEALQALLQAVAGVQAHGTLIQLIRHPAAVQVGPARVEDRK